MGLQEKIRHQELEIDMLKRYKYQMQKCKLELEKEKIQNKLLVNRLKSMPNEEKNKKSNTPEDYSISFELSKDDISTIL